MSVFFGVARETEGRRGSQRQLVEGGRYLDTPGNEAPTAINASTCDDHPNLSLFFVSHLRGSLQVVRSNSDGEAASAASCPPLAS